MFKLISNFIIVYRFSEIEFKPYTISVRCHVCEYEYQQYRLRQSREYMSQFKMLTILKILSKLGSKKLQQFQQISMSKQFQHLCCIIFIFCLNLKNFNLFFRKDVHRFTKINIFAILINKIIISNVFIYYAHVLECTWILIIFENSIQMNAKCFE